MKFFTLDTYHQWASGKHSLAMCDRYRAYEDHLESLKGLLPDELLDLGRILVGDALVASVSSSYRRKTLRLVLRAGGMPEGYFDIDLNYEGAEVWPTECLLRQIALETESSLRHPYELCYHEIDRMEDGLIEHRFLWHPGVILAVRCRGLTWRRVDRANRDLPPAHRRYVSD